METIETATGRDLREWKPIDAARERSGFRLSLRGFRYGVSHKDLAYFRPEVARTIRDCRP